MRGSWSMTFAYLPGMPSPKVFSMVIGAGLDEHIFLFVWTCIPRTRHHVMPAFSPACIPFTRFLPDSPPFYQRNAPHNLSFTSIVLLHQVGFNCVFWNFEFLKFPSGKSESL